MILNTFSEYMRAVIQVLSEHPYYYTLCTIGYLVIYFGGVAILIRMWRKAKREQKEHEEERDE